MTPALFVPLASGGLVYAFSESTLPGRLVLLSLFIVSIFSWAIMLTKFRVINAARRADARFRTAFRADRQPLRLYEEGEHFDGSPLYRVYRAGCEEATF